MSVHAKKNSGFTDEEREAIRTRAQELAEERRAGKKADGERAVLDAISAMTGPDGVLARRIHELVLETAPGLRPKTWYGMPAYAKDGVVVCFFQSAKRFKTRYATLGFNDAAKLDSGNLWPTAFALRDITPAEEKTIRGLVKKAVG